MPNDDSKYPVPTQLALIRRDIREINKVLFGGDDKKGIVHSVEQLKLVADRGRFTMRVAIWLGGTIVAAATAAAQFRQVFSSWFGGVPPHP